MEQRMNLYSGAPITVRLAPTAQSFVLIASLHWPKGFEAMKAEEKEEIYFKGATGIFVIGGSMDACHRAIPSVSA